MLLASSFSSMSSSVFSVSFIKDKAPNSAAKTTAAARNAFFIRLPAFIGLSGEKGIEGSWPWFLGYNKIKAKKEADEIAVIDGEDTFMAAMEYGKGRTFAFASDCAMHWGSKEFLAWDGYQKLIPNIFRWLAKEL